MSEQKTANKEIKAQDLQEIIQNGNAGLRIAIKAFEDLSKLSSDIYTIAVNLQQRVQELESNKTEAPSEQESIEQAEEIK